MARRVAAVGGTFDPLHLGHERLLRRAAAASSHLVVGLATDSLARRRGKSPRPYAERKRALEKLLGELAGSWEIAGLDDEFGPAVLGPGVDVLVVSEETAAAGAKLNSLRAGRGLEPVEVVVVPMARAADGRTASSTRVRRGEMSPDGGPPKY